LNLKKKGETRVNPIQKKKQKIITSLSLAIAAAAVLVTVGLAAVSSFPIGGTSSNVAMAQVLGNQTFDTGQTDTTTTTDTTISTLDQPGSIVTFPIVSSALLSNVLVSLEEATGIAIADVDQLTGSEASVTDETTTVEGQASHAVEAALRTQEGYLVWVVSVIDPDLTLHRVVVDPMTGDVLANVERPNAGFETGPGLELQQQLGNFTLPQGNQSFPAEP